jgi:hypothetical protein
VRGRSYVMYVGDKTFIEIFGEKYRRKDIRWEMCAWIIG